jgi:trans-aconitate 2-methyltransferase
MTKAKDWNASQYLKFENERTLPTRNLLDRVPLSSPKRIIDLGCGPGNSTSVLATRYPDAKITGLDSSPDMIKKAQTVLPERDFHVADLTTYKPEAGDAVDLFFSSAVFHWLTADDRIEVIRRLLEPQAPGSVFAIQVPNNLSEPVHVLMRETAAEGPWAGKLAGVQRNELESVQVMYDRLKPFCGEVHVWETSYYHSVEGPEAVVEWVKGAGLKPFVDSLEGGEREAFLEAYLEKIKGAYPVSVDGRVLFKFPRLFMVAVK